MENTKRPNKTYRMSSGLNKFQKQLYTHLIEYKWNVMGITEPGTYKGQTYDYMFSKSYEKGYSPVLYKNPHPELDMLQKLIVFTFYMNCIFQPLRNKIAYQNLKTIKIYLAIGM